MKFGFRVGVDYEISNRIGISVLRIVMVRIFMYIICYVCVYKLFLCFVVLIVVNLLWYCI